MFGFVFVYKVYMCGERGRLALYIGCVYMPTDSTSVAVLDTCYERKTYLVSGKRER